MVRSQVATLQAGVTCVLIILQDGSYEGHFLFVDVSSLRCHHNGLHFGPFAVHLLIFFSKGIHPIYGIRNVAKRRIPQLKSSIHSAVFRFSQNATVNSTNTSSVTKNPIKKVHVPNIFVPPPFPRSYRPVPLCHLLWVDSLVTARIFGAVAKKERL